MRPTLENPFVRKYDSVIKRYSFIFDDKNWVRRIERVEIQHVLSLLLFILLFVLLEQSIFGENSHYVISFFGLLFSGIIAWLVYIQKRSIREWKEILHSFTEDEFVAIARELRDLHKSPSASKHMGFQDSPDRWLKDRPFSHAKKLLSLDIRERMEGIKYVLHNDGLSDDLRYVNRLEQTKKRWDEERVRDLELEQRLNSL